MHLFYCDETNLEARSGEFFIYGGLMLSSESADYLHGKIAAIRNSFNIPLDYNLKFNPGPRHLNHNDFISVKSEVIKEVGQSGGRLLAYAILHDVATDPDKARRNGINTLCYNYNNVLCREGRKGIVLIDRFNDTGNRIDSHLKEKFSQGLTGMPYGNEVKLTNILGLHYSAVGQSHFCSVIDVVLGSLRFAMNAKARNEQNNLRSAQTIIETISPLFWRINSNGSVPEIGFTLSPKSVRAHIYREKYSELKEFFYECGLELEQEITANATY